MKWQRNSALQSSDALALVFLNFSGMFSFSVQSNWCDSFFQAAGFFVIGIPTWISWMRFFSFIFYGFNLVLHFQFQNRTFYNCGVLEVPDPTAHLNGEGGILCYPVTGSELAQAVRLQVRSWRDLNFDLVSTQEPLLVDSAWKIWPSDMWAMPSCQPGFSEQSYVAFNNGIKCGYFLPNQNCSTI